MTRCGKGVGTLRGSAKQSAASYIEMRAFSMRTQAASRACRLIRWTLLWEVSRFVQIVRLVSD